MAKKNKRQSRRETSVSMSTRKSVAPPSRQVEFEPDYSYIIKDLRRIGILAASFFTILVVLAFIIR
jgi:hypothetical protein